MLHPALALTAGQLAAVFADNRGIALRQLQREFVAVGKLCRRQDFIVARILFPDADVLQNAVVEQCHILKNDGINAQQGFRINVGNVLSADCNPAPADIPESCSQPGDCGLPSAGRADKRRNLALLRSKCDIPQNCLFFIIGKTDIVNLP